MIVRQTSHLPATTGTIQKTGLDQIGLIHILDRALVFLNRGSQGLHADRSSIELFDDGEQDFAVHVVETRLIDPDPG